MKAEEAVKKLEEIAEQSDADPETAHVKADSILCQCLVELGHKEIVDAYDKVYKWYA